MSSKLDLVQHLISQGQNAKAKAACLRLVQSSPTDPRAAGLMALIHMNLAELPQAVHYARRAADLSPGDARALRNLASVLVEAGSYDEAVRELDRAVAINDRDAEAHVMAAVAHAMAGRHAASLWRAEAALAADGPTPAACSVAGNALLNLGRVGEAVEMLRLGVDRSPESPSLVSELCLALNYLPGADPGRVLAAHRAYGELVAGSAAPVRRRTRHGGTTLRVGIVSPDLRQHSVAFFVLPWLRHRDRTAFEVVAFHTNRHEDAMTSRLRALCDAWVGLGNASDALVAQHIADRDVDILLELSGHTAGHVLSALAMRPAALQASWIGYPNTTGVPGVGWRIVDSVTDPPGSESLATERLARLDPCFLCFSPPDNAPDALDRPAGHVTFGSFNAAAKINDEVLGLWSRVLAAVPGSRLVLKAVHYQEQEARAMLETRWVRAGGDPSRLAVLPPMASQRDHLAAYGEIDVALDPFPYHGTTTTCEALWMGVPVVTLEGRVHASRVGASLLRAVGEPGWIARDEAQYVRIAADLASGPRRSRAALRQRVQGSALCDEARYAARFEAALRTMWEQQSVS